MISNSTYKKNCWLSVLGEIQSIIFFKKKLFHIYMQRISCFFKKLFCNGKIIIKLLTHTHTL